MPKAKPKVMVYIPLVGGSPIVGLELRRSGGRIYVGQPAHVQINSEQTNYQFSPFQFISRDHRLYESGLIADGPAATHMQEDYLAWVEKRTEKAE
jgi:hypothetical protein